ncbi:FtsX-like permease family protein, partial [Actinomadura rubrobrunea]
APAADGEVAITRHAARAGRLDVGGAMTLLLPHRVQRVTVTGIVTVQGRGAVAAGHLVLAPPAAVADAARLPAGSWQSVWVKTAPGVPADRLRGELARALDGAATVRTAASVRNAQTADVRSAGASIGGAIGMLASVAIFVGLFVVANTFGTLVRQRARRLALLSAIGATPRQVKRLIRLEALVVGAVAAAGGVAAGYPVSALLTRLFAEEGFDISAADAQFGWIALLVPAAAGILVTQLAAWRAARRAAGISPIQALRTAAAETRGRRRPRLLGAAVVFAGACGWYGLSLAVRADEPPGPDRTVAVALMILFATLTAVAALALLAPFFVGPLGGLVGRVAMLVAGETGRLARAAVTRSPLRVSSAASALMLGVALVVATALIALSVHARFDEAGRRVLAADHVVAATGVASDGAGAPLPRDTADRVAAVPGVSRAVALTQTEVKLVAPARRPSPDEDAKPFVFTVSGVEQTGMRDVLRLGGRLRALRPGEIALSSTVVAAQRLHRGQRITVRGATGRVALTVAVVYHDPSHLFADQALAAPATMDRIDPNAATQAVLVRGGSADDLARAVAGVSGARVLDRAAYVDHAAGAATRGLTLMYGFLGMSLLLALFGMATTVSMSVFERTREFGLLGAVGATAGQIRSIVRWEAATVVVLGTLLGVGVAVGAVALLHVTTGSSFLRPQPPWWLFPLVAAGAAAVTLATSALPARRAAAVPVLEAAKAE